MLEFPKRAAGYIPEYLMKRTHKCCLEEELFSVFGDSYGRRGTFVNEEIKPMIKKGDYLLFNSSAYAQNIRSLHECDEHENLTVNVAFLSMNDDVGESDSSDEEANESADDSEIEDDGIGGGDEDEEEEDKEMKGRQKDEVEGDVEEEDDVVVCALRSIFPGEELIYDSGPRIWDTEPLFPQNKNKK